jgi:hypothetical protein
MGSMGMALRKTTEDLRPYRERIRELVEADRVKAARELLAEALKRGDHGEDLSGWQRVLAPAKTLKVESSTSTARSTSVGLTRMKRLIVASGLRSVMESFSPVLRLWRRCLQLWRIILAENAPSFIVSTSAETRPSLLFLWPLDLC